MTTTARSGRTRSDRNRHLAAIHIAAEQLGMDRETYESMLFNVAGTRSAANLNPAGIKLVLDALKKLGWQPKRHSLKMPPGRITKRQIELIRHIWKCLGAAGHLRRPDGPGLRTFVQRSTPHDALEFLPRNTAIELTERLKKWAARTDVDWKNSV